jgi:hypothetical protein
MNAGGSSSLCGSEGALRIATMRSRTLDVRHSHVGDDAHTCALNSIARCIRWRADVWPDDFVDFTRRRRHLPAPRLKGEIMKRKLSLLALGGFAFVPALGGCGNSLSFPQANTATPSPAGTPTRTAAAQPTQTATVPVTDTPTVSPTPSPTPTATVGTCTTELVAPLLESPAMWETVDSLVPMLSWSYPDIACVPQEYRVSLSTGPLFVDDLSGATGNPSTVWLPGAPLQPGKEYEWAVEPIVGPTLGPIAGFRYFFTGPACAPDSLATPSLLQPLDDAIVSDPAGPFFSWTYPDPCLPGGYGVRLATSTDFEGSPLNGGTGTPSSRWVPGTDLADCTRYYWQVVACTDTQCGPYSEIRTFRIMRSAACPGEVR